MSGVFKSANPVLSKYMRNAMLTALKTNPAAALWLTPKIALSQQVGFNPLPTDTDASLRANVATFTGYTDQVPAFTVPVNVGAQTEALITTVVFVATGSAVANSITGYWGTDGTNMYLAEAFPVSAPIQVAVANDYVQIDLILPINAFQLAA